MPLAHDPSELSAWLRLSLEPGLNPADAYALLGATGLPQHLYASSIADLAQWVPAPLARQLAAPPLPALAARIAAALDWVSRPGHHLLCLADPAYPRSLLDVGDPPPLLYVRGNPAMLCQPALAIVGARNASVDGRDNAHAFARHLAAQGWNIVSGMAAGIDAAAHEGALAVAGNGAMTSHDRNTEGGMMSGDTPTGGTIAVLGTGVDVVYPAQHADLADRIAQLGALVSEFPLGTPALPQHFPRRNRLVAGLSRGVLVVEAASRSGSLITARLAGEYGREVFAIPGSIHSPLTRGCHALIRQGAKLVESAEDIEDELAAPGQSPLRPAPKRQPGNVETADAVAGTQHDPATTTVLACLGHDPVHRELLMQRCGLPSADLDAVLLRLELAGKVARRESGYYQRSSAKSAARGKD
ncbi:DNA-processing protein DprA [Bordetella sp. N]|uniref:DNA-processing protein DprA n=1 Tax=Bordetella sp. N TaxID=1746199 RepID=UPI00070AB439|nr:DNA-processing protein DprA [Bordetella sp. N]ALM85214.1 DNA processing protein DprA [Bordetella sp. N]